LASCSSSSTVDEDIGVRASALPVCSTPSSLVTSLNSASQSDTLSLGGVNPINCPEVSMTETWGGGKLIFSDSPEYPSGRGKLYEDSGLDATSGTDYNRVFLYHVNGKSSGKIKFAVLVKNLGTSSGTLQVQQSGTAGPSTSYLYVGKMAFDRWLLSSPKSSVNVAPGQTVELDSTFDGLKANPNYLLEGIWDYSFTQPHQITICSLEANDNVLQVCPSQSILPRDVHQRGTFPYANKVYDTSVGTVVDTVDGIQQFGLSSGLSYDNWSVGTDVTDGSSQTLKGNYGILYRMHLNVASSDGQNFGFLLNPRGGTWGGAVWAAPGLTPGGKFLIPPSTGSLGDNTKGSVEGKYDPATVSAPWLQFMPAGGAAFPLRFVMVPY